MMCGWCGGLAYLLGTWQWLCAVVHAPSGPPGLAPAGREPEGGRHGAQQN
jgi:hypothetical protein